MPVMSGMDFLKTAGERIGQSTVIMMSAYGNIDTAIETMKRGAYDYISKPFKPDEVLLTLKKAEERESLRRENRRLKARIEEIEKYFRFGNMVAKSRAMISVFQLAQKAARYSTTVLILGESGTGKELIARGIHYEGERANRPLVPVNCGGIPENLLESELFGYKKGAFTGADRNKKGLFQEADGGNDFSGRDRRAAAVPAGQAAAGASGKRDSSGGGFQADTGRRSGDCRYGQEPGGRGQARPVP